MRPDQSLQGTGRGGLRRQIFWALIVVFTAGALAGGLWYKQKLVWQIYLDTAFKAGISLFETVEAVRFGAPFDGAAVTGLRLSLSSPKKTISASNSIALDFTDLAGRSFETRLSLLDFRRPDAFEGQRIGIRIFSRKIKYATTYFASPKGDALSLRFGALVQGIASFCGDSLVFVNINEGRWLRIEDAGIWGCDNAPRDWRLLVVIAAGVLLAAFLTMGANLVEHLRALARAITTRAEAGGFEPLKTSGPAELQVIANAINRFFDQEKIRLEKRADLLSGISHDLGTPATRLKLRTALIEDQKLRARLERDIDHMTQMIESVLAYTRNEMEVEAPRRLSLVSLVQSVVDDYADLGLPVSLNPVDHLRFEAPHTVFSTGVTRAPIDLSDQARVLCSCRPNALRRALSNLIDNALKYGKSATVSLTATADQVALSIQDAGGPNQMYDLKTLTAPFKQGSNARVHDGVGLGLTIVANIVQSHGGSLSFDRTAEGTCVTMNLPRR